jgi:parallel beta-helix repeat protein
MGRGWRGLALSAGTMLCMTGTVSAATLAVPADYSTIQAAIDAASGGDTVLVAPGEYVQSLRCKSGVTVQGAGAEVTTIRGDGSVVEWGWTCTVRGADNCTIAGFTITGSYFGILNNGSSPTITDNTISGNTDTGIYNMYASPVITNNTITGSYYGILNYYYPSTITNNKISGNREGILN